MESLVVYDSTFGNTRKVAEAIAHGLGAHGPVRVLGLNKLIPQNLGTVNLLVVGGPTHAHGITARMRQFLDELETRPGTGMVAATFDTRYRMPKVISGSAARTIARKLRHAGLRQFAPPASFFVSRQGRQLEPGETERAQTWAKNVVEGLALSHWCAA